MVKCSRELLYALIPMCGSVIFGSTIAYGSATINYIKIEFGPLSTFEIAAFQSLPAIVSIFAPHLWNLLLSKFRLKTVASVVGFSGALFWLLLLLMNKKYFWFAIVVRGLHGIILAGVCTVTPLYIVSMATEEEHGLFGSLHAVGIAIGYVLFNLIGVTHRWQYPIYGSVCFLLVLGSLVWIIPDDLCKYSKQASNSTSEKLENNKNDNCNNDNNSNNSTASFEESETDNKSTLNDGNKENVVVINVNDSIFDRKYRKTLITSMIMMFCAQFSGTGSIIQNIAPLLSEVGLSIDPGYQASIALSAQLLMLLIGSVLMDRFGGRVLWLWSAGGTTLSLLIYALNVRLSWSSWLPMVSLFAYQLFFGLGLASVPWYLLPENFPQHLKRTAQSIGTSMNWIAASVMMFMFPYLNKWLGQFGVMILLMGINVLVTLFGLFFVHDHNFDEKKRKRKQKDEGISDIEDVLITEDDNSL